jgi:hypothetical protein
MVVGENLLNPLGRRSKPLYACTAAAVARAAVLPAPLSLANLLVPFLMPSDGVPAVVVYSGIVLGVFGLT